jgi:hypothetical protein
LRIIMERFEKRHQWLATYLDEGNALVLCHVETIG